MSNVRYVRERKLGIPSQPYSPLLGIRNDLSVTIADGVGVIRMKYSILLINLALSFEICTLN